jgi:hypothetical protein
MAIRKSWTPTSRTTSGAFRRPLEVGGRRIVDRRVLHLIKMWLDLGAKITAVRRPEHRRVDYAAHSVEQ